MHIFKLLKFKYDLPKSEEYRPEKNIDAKKLEPTTDLTSTDYLSIV